MSRKLKIKTEETEVKIPVEVVPEVTTKEVLKVPEKIAIDFTNEGLNNMARKINEIIDYVTIQK